MRRLLPLVLLSCACWPQNPSSEPNASLDGALAELVDAAARTDADPSCSAWHAIEAPLLSATLLDSETPRVARSARLRVSLSQCPGDRPGSWSATPTHVKNLPEQLMSMQVMLWRSGNDCEDSETVTRELHLLFPSPGSWMILAGDQPLVVDVLDEEAGNCGSASPTACERDCDCQGAERCLSGQEGTTLVRRCARPCEFDRECRGEGVCGDESGLQGICVSASSECELPARPCAPGFECLGNRCEPSFDLNQFTRHECSCDDECDPGLACAESLVGDQLLRRCEALCASPSDGWCQGAHSCNPAAFGGQSSGVCEWLGE